METTTKSLCFNRLLLLICHAVVYYYEELYHS